MVITAENLIFGCGLNNLGQLGIPGEGKDLMGLTNFMNSKTKDPTRKAYLKKN